MQKKRLTLEQMVNVVKAVNITEQLDTLDGNANFNLSRNKSKALKTVEDYYKDQQKLEQQLTEECKDKTPDEVKKLNDAYIEKLTNMLAAEQEEIEWHDVRLSFFIAQYDFKRAVRGADGKIDTIEYKKGQAIVPGVVFTLLDPLITE